MEISSAGIFSNKGRSGSSGAECMVQKTSDFSKLWCDGTDKGEGEDEPVRTFFGQAVRGQFFAILCGRLLWTGP